MTKWLTEWLSEWLTDWQNSERDRGARSWLTFDYWLPICCRFSFFSLFFCSIQAQIACLAITVRKFANLLEKNKLPERDGTRPRERDRANDTEGRTEVKLWPTWKLMEQWSDRRSGSEIADRRSERWRRDHGCCRCYFWLLIFQCCQHTYTKNNNIIRRQAEIRAFLQKINQDKISVSEINIKILKIYHTWRVKFIDSIFKKSSIIFSL